MENPKDEYEKYRKMFDRAMDAWHLTDTTDDPSVFLGITHEDWKKFVESK